MMTKQTNLILSIFLIFLTTIFGCKKEDQTRLQASWSANDPILIPYNIRNNEIKLGNLVKNASFETGKMYYEKGNIKSYDITGWKKVGHNIKWVSINHENYNTDEVYEGTHSIKIERNNADETEQTGEGIISDFIKVIPGNYSFNFFLKLENACPNQARLGTKMYDAVNIRLQFYDKNKIQINGDVFDAFHHKRIDNTFKSLSLSNFWQIEKLDWSEVSGKTAQYPFFDGDIPDEARYVKIYIGLKGTGKMWIDNVDFRFTDKNLTMLERMKPYFDSSYLAYDLVYPEPKQMIRKNKIDIFNQELSLFPVIVIPENASIQIKEAAKDIKKMLVSMIKKTDHSLIPEIKIVKKINKLTDNQFIVSVGNSSLYKNYKTSLPDTVLNSHENAYYIIQPENNNMIVFINGVNDVAIQYAVQTFQQLFNPKSLRYNAANIIDYPEVIDRAILLHYFDEKIDELNDKLNLFSNYKFNEIYFEWNNEDNNNLFPFNSVDDLQNMNKVLNYSLMIDLVKLNAKQAINAKNEHIKFQSAISDSYQSVLILGDYYQSYENYNQEKVVFFSNKDLVKNLQLDHIQLLNEMNKKIADQHLSTKLEFLSPWNRLDLIDKGQGAAEIYYNDINRNVSDQISMFWTGGTYYSESIDDAEWLRIKQILGRSPILFDNSLLASDHRLNTDFLKSYYAGKIRTLSIFEPFDLKTSYDFQEHSKLLLNTENLSELNTIRILTASNYLWNTKTYHPDKSLWIVLTKLYGREQAIALIHFNDSYYGLSEICQKIVVDGFQFKNLRIAKNFETELIKYYKELENKLDNKKMLSELEKLKTEILLKYRNLITADK